MDFAREIGNTIYGLDAHFNYLGFKTDGEYLINTHYYMFADGAPGTGYPLTKPMDLTPREGHRSTLTDNAYYVVAQKDWQCFGFTGEYFKMGKFCRPSMQYFLPILEREYTFLYNCYNEFLRISMIADNDDDDKYHDVMPYAQVMSSSTGYIAVMDPDEVFPSNDLDHNALPYNEKNDKNYPDV